jgi:hypothetical protein
MTGATLCLALASLAAPPGDLVARAACEPPSADVGEPVRVVIEIGHDREVDVRGLLSKPVELDPSWVLLGREIEPPRADPAEPARFLSRCVLSVASLEPGARSLAAELSRAFQDERLASFDASAAHVDVASVLAEGEDAPRPLRGLPESFGAPAGEAGLGAFVGRSALRWILAGAALVVLASAAYVVRRERARRRRAVSSQDPLAALERFAPARGTPAGALRERAYELSHFLRATVDRRFSLAHGGLTDEEWLAALESSAAAAPELVAELRAFCARTESIKYAGAEPSEWAHGELLASARRALELVLAGPPPAPAKGEAA